MSLDASGHSQLSFLHSTFTQLINSPSACCPKQSSLRAASFLSEKTHEKTAAITKRCHLHNSNKTQLTQSAEFVASLNSASHDLIPLDHPEGVVNDMMPTVETVWKMRLSPNTSPFDMFLQRRCRPLETTTGQFLGWARSSAIDRNEIRHRWMAGPF